MCKSKTRSRKEQAISSDATLVLVALAFSWQAEKSLNCVNADLIIA